MMGGDFAFGVAPEGGSGFPEALGLCRIGLRVSSLSLPEYEELARGHFLHPSHCLRDYLPFCHSLSQPVLMLKNVQQCVAICFGNIFFFSSFFGPHAVVKFDITLFQFEPKQKLKKHKICKY